MKPLLEILAGIPTVVYGYFVILFVTPYFIKPLFDWLGFFVHTTNSLSAAIVVGIMIIPMVASLSEDAIRAVPKSLREGGYALGSTKFDVSIKIIVPAAFSGIVASFILAISRAIGETMAVSMAADNSTRFSLSPLEPSFTMTSYIVETTKGEAELGSIQYQSLYAVAIDLRKITTVMKITGELERIADLAIHIAERFNNVLPGLDFPIFEQLDSMKKKSIELLQRSIASYVSLDSAKARDVIRDDDIVDDLNKIIIDELLDYMK